MTDQSFTIDTNFFISGFGESPNAYEILNKIFRKNRITIYIPNYVQKEMRWYMRRVIEKHLTVIDVNAKKLEQYEIDCAKKVDIKLPQTPDVAVAYVAEQEGIPIVSSDMRLVELGQQLGLDAMMNSAFVIMLLEEITDAEDRDFLTKLYEKLFSEEITYSVQSQSRYDPVVRIQKIMDSAMSVIRNQATIRKTSPEKTKPAEISYDFPAYHEMIEVTKEVRTDLSEYLQIMEEGNYQKLEVELRQSTTYLTDLSTEVRMAGVDEEDPNYKEAMTTVAHLLLLESSVALGDQKLEHAEAIVDLLLLLLLENDEVEERLDIEVHLLRITLFFLTDQLNRLKFYFTPTFSELCRRRERTDILDLHRTMSIIMLVLSSGQAEKTATVRDFSEIQYVIQLGMQFNAVNQAQKAWLLFEQAVYLSLNSKMNGLLLAVFEVLLPLSFVDDHQFSPSFDELLGVVKKKVKNLPFEDFEKRSKPKLRVPERLIVDTLTPVKKLPLEFTGFLDVISAEEAEFKRIGKVTFVKVIDWSSMQFIGIIDPSRSIDPNLTVGSSIQLHTGNFRIVRPSKSIRDTRKVNLLMMGKSANVKFIIRRSGQLTVAQSQVAAYDL